MTPPAAESGRGAGRAPGPIRRPLDLPRLVMQRAAAMAVLGVLVLLLLGLVRMRDDVDEELQGARTLAQLSALLVGLSAQSDQQARLSLQDWRRTSDVRHLLVRVVDQHGRIVMVAGADHQMSTVLRGLAQAGARMFTATAPFTVTWALPRPEGGAWSVTLTPAPESERIEAMGSLLEGVALLGMVAVGMLGVMTWNTRRAFRPLDRLLDAINGLETADHRLADTAARRLPTMPIAELETIAAALRHLDDSLRAAQQQRRHLSRQVLSLQEDERARLARELHDEFGQHLTALRVNAAWLARRTADDAVLLPVVRDMAGQCELIQQDIRAVLTRLRPLPGFDADSASDDESLEQLGELLQGLIDSWQRTGGSDTGFTLSLQLRRADGAELDWDEHAPRWRLSREGVLSLYRISQEALTNVARHAGATKALLSLTVTLPVATGQAALVDWWLSDDGIGVRDPQAAFRRGNGLAGLSDRVWALGADLQLGTLDDSGARPGCRLSTRLSLPIRCEAG